ncbi:glycosyltransferase family 2 protein [Georgenia alba]|uniref:Glycosyltransferase family 2 protein n=1 Tax=Georgenia alba TaxID=2233858 RepID=A0ABW2Q8C0_9MICO
MVATTDVLMITYNSAEHVRRSLPHLLDTCDEHTRVWLWHNGDDEETLAVVREHADDARVHRFHHSRENVRLTAPTNWLWTESEGTFVSKVDDDCLPEPGWVERLRDAHAANPDFGAVGCWRFRDEDFVPELASRKIQTFAGGYRLLRNHWVQGSGYLLPRAKVLRQGPLRQGQSFTHYCIALARAGAVNGWLYPFVREDNMDDPRSASTLFVDDAAFRRRMPLTAQALGITSVTDWARQEHESALAVQKASLDLREYGGWRAKRTLVRRRVERLVRGRGSW